MNKSEWLQSLKAGDKVAVNYMHNLYLATVSRVTATQIVIVHKNGVGNKYDVKYSKDRGYKIGGDKWHSETLEMLTDELLEKIKQRGDRARFENIAGGKKTIIEIRAMLEAYDALQTKEKHHEA